MFNFFCQAELDQHVEALTNVGCDVSCISYMKKWKAFNKVASGPIQTGSGQSTYSAMFNRIMSTGSKFVMEGVKSLVVGTKNLPVTRIVDHIMEQKNSPEIDDYRYFDPKMLKQNENAQQKKTFQEVTKCFVYVVVIYLKFIQLLVTTDLNFSKAQLNNVCHTSVSHFPVKVSELTPTCFVEFFFYRL